MIMLKEMAYDINSFSISSMKQFLLLEELKIALRSVNNCVPPLLICAPNTCN